MKLCIPVDDTLWTLLVVWRQHSFSLFSY